MSTALSVEDLQLGKRGDRLSSVSISIEDGVFFGLVGMNGAGKTSFLEALKLCLFGGGGKTSQN